MDNYLKEYFLRIEEILLEINKNLQEIKKHFDNSKSQKISTDKNLNDVFKSISTKEQSYSTALIEFLEESQKEPNEQIKSNSLFDYFTSRYITIKSFGSDKLVTDPLNQVVEFLGNKFHLVQPFLERLRSALNNGSQISMFLGNTSPESISAICQLGRLFLDYALLESFTYLRSPRYMLYARPNKTPIAINFISGKWAELYVHQKLNDIISKLALAIDFEILINPVLKLPDLTEVELDLFFKINGNYFLIEVKTSNYQSFTKRYQKVNRYLKLNPENSFLIITQEITPEIKKFFKETHKITLVKINEFYSEFLLRIREIYDKSLEQETQEDSETGFTSIE